MKIFLASSNELFMDRVMFGDMVRWLDNAAEKYGQRVYLFKWEDFDAAYNNERKQSEYDREIEDSDVFVVLFHVKAGKYTIEEFEEAVRELRKTKKRPRIFIFCKDLEDGEIEDADLKAFKEKLKSHYGHFWDSYSHWDALRFRFISQLLQGWLGLFGSVTMEMNVMNGVVKLGELKVAELENLPFAANCKEYQRLLDHLEELEQRKEALKGTEASEEVREALDKDHSETQQRIKDYRQYIFNIAMDIIKKQQDGVSEKLLKAKNEFEKGNIAMAKQLLAEIEEECDSHFAQWEKMLELVHQDIDALAMEANVVMLDTSMSVDDRVGRAKEIYEKAVRMAEKSQYDKMKFADLLHSYGNFLKKRNQKIAVALLEHRLRLLELIYGSDNLVVAGACDDIARVWKEIKGNENLDRAWAYLEKALKIQKEFGPKHPDVARTYRLMGEVQMNRKQHSGAKTCFEKALRICEDILGVVNSETGQVYRDLGWLYKELYEQEKDDALFELSWGFFKKAIEVLEITSGEENEETLYAYNNFANLYRVAGQYDESLNLHKKSLGVKERVFGFYHLSIAAEYNNMGNVYYDMEEYDEALKCYFKALKIKENLLHEGDYSFSNTYWRIGRTYRAKGQVEEAEKYLVMALSIRKNHLKEGDGRIKQVQDELDLCRR